MALVLGNFALSRLVTPPSGTSGLTFTITTNDGAKFPTLGVGGYFYGVFSNPNQTTFEVVKIVTISGDNFTIAAASRGLDGSTAQTWNVGDLFYYPMTRAMLVDYKPNTAGVADSIVNQANSATIAAGSTNVQNTIVLRDSSGNFSAGSISASLNGNASTATNATNATRWNGANKTVSASGPSGGSDGDIWFQYA